MTKFKEIVLALDLSLNSPGYAVMAIEPDTNKPLVLEVGHVNNNKIVTPRNFQGMKIVNTADKVDELIKKYEPTVIIRERGYTRHSEVTQKLFKVVGAVELVMTKHGYKGVVEYPPQTVKKAVTGSGRSSKADVEKAVLELLSIDKEDFFSNDDESDACAVGLTYYINRGMVVKETVGVDEDTPTREG